MKSLFDKISKCYNKYQTLNRRISNIMPTKENVKSIIFALLMSLFTCSVPLLIGINLLVFTAYIGYILAYILAVLIAVIWLYFAIFYKLLVMYQSDIKEVNTRYIQLVESIFLSSIVLILGIIIIIGVMA